MALVALSATLASCKVQQPFPGADVLATFAFEATPTTTDCTFSDPQDAVPDAGSGIDCAGGTGAAFCFEGTFSRDPITGSVFWTLLGRSWPATFDGQFASVTTSAPRRFAECTPVGDAGTGLCDPVGVVETLNVALLSVDQSRAVGNACPANPLDGGLPPDAGPPQPTGAGLDVAIACGELNDAVLPDAGCSCTACTYHYLVSGLRR